MINRVTNLPTVSSGYSELYCRSEASLKSGGAERSGERALQKNDGAERSAEREVAERERSGEWGCRNRLKRGAAFSPLTLRSHALVIISKCQFCFTEMFKSMSSNNDSSEMSTRFCIRLL